MDRRRLEQMVRKMHASGCLIESIPDGGHITTRLNRFFRALQQDLIHSEGWPTAG